MPKKKPIRVINSLGQKVRLLRPGEKSNKFALELKTNNRYTNEGQVKNRKNGKVMTLTDTQKAWRSGYLTARADNTKVFNYLKNKEAKTSNYSSNTSITRNSFKSNNYSGKSSGYSTKKW